jgi:hypothetical protein
MNTHKKTILSIVVIIGIVMHFSIGYFHWDIVAGKDGTDILYGVTAYFLMDVLGLCLFVLHEQLKSSILRGVGILLMILSTYYIGMEFNDPYNWAALDYKILAVLVMAFINLGFIFYFTDILRKL